ncbi:AMP-binding enzyme [Lophium mytilinum]|uniref:AMP-binding enzyme n=1 Tax=Lophium mytilinum TaxID=390894 RepID=A0A6A6R9T4_9PEZI|nr:AMP-binding enzyme [Lophium mytilinum]
MRVYKAPQTIDIPQDLNLTELLHTSNDPPLPPSHLITKDSLTNRSITIGELRQRAGRIANGLNSTLKPHDQSRWAVILPNSVEYLEVFHAVLWVGGVACPINHAIKAEEIGHAFSVTRPDFVIVYGPALSKVLEAVEVARRELATEGVTWDTPKIVTVIESADGFKHIPDDFLAPEKLAIPHFSDTKSRLATIHLSSGTTGKPKGVELTHFNFVSNVYQLRAHDPAQFHRGSRVVAFTPFAHIGNTTIPLFLGPFMGMMHHAMPAYDLETFGQLVDSNKATIFQGVPSVVLSFANTDIADRFDFSKAEVINVGGPPFKRDMLERLLNKAPWRLNQVYGMTEGAGYVAYQRSTDNQLEGVVGPLVPNIEVALRINEGKDDAPENGPGELWLRGPNITRGYAFNTEANQSAFPQEGWYNTGDVCTVSRDGVIAVVGRTKELIKYKGFQVSPAELESYLNSHSHVAEAGVGPVFDESQLTELPTAYVILKDHLVLEKDKRTALKEIHATVDDRVSGYKKLRGGVWEVKLLPKNPTGKILRKQLQDHKSGLSSLDRGDRRSKL